MKPALPADLRALLNEALAPDPPAPRDDLRVKRRVLAAIAAASTPSHHTVPAGEPGWHDFGPGLRRKVLLQAGDGMAYLLRLAAGASIPPHRHPADEECVVLEGELRIGTLCLGPGSFHLARRGALHERIVSDKGALIYLRGAPPELAHLV